MASISRLALGLAATAVLAAAPAQSGNRANWPLAARFSNENVQLFVGTPTVNATFLNKTDKFYYRWRDSRSSKWYLVDPDAKKKRPLFDHVKMAADLSMLTKRPYDAINLPINTLEFDEKRPTFKFQVENKWYEFDMEKETLVESKATRTPEQIRAEAEEYRNWAPDKKCFVYAENHNLFFVEVGDDKKEGAPVQLSTDGEEYYSFGGTRSFLGGDGAPPTDPRRKVRPNVNWAPDSKRFSTVRTDSRKVKELWLVNVLAEPRPTLMTYKYAMPGEEFVSQMELWTFDRSEKKLARAKTDKWKDQRLFNVHWPATSDRLRYIRRDRLQRNLELMEIDLKTGLDKALLAESVENAFLETREVRYVKDGGDFIWWSERSGWGHLYLYGHDGTLKRPITGGAWRVDNVADLDAEKGIVYFTAVGREENENPYYEHLYRVRLDGAGLTMLTPGDANHTAEISPNKKYVVDSYSRVDMTPRSVLRNMDGDVVMELEEMDVNRLKETGWRLPERFIVKAADGITDIFGNMWKPFDFNPNKSYPIILNVYPGPQTESVTDTFASFSGNQQLAQLGFIVIQVGNRGGNPQRSNAYHSFGYYNLRDYGLADKKAAVEQLCARHAYIDIDRVGIYGHSGGGFMTAAAMMLPPYNTFFKVGVSSAGNHDNNIYNQNWSEQHHGLRIVTGEQQTGTGQNQGGRRGGGGRIPPTWATPADARLPELEDVVDAPLYLPTFLDEPQGGQLGGEQQQTGQQGAQTQGAQRERFEIKVPTTVELAANLRGKLLLVHGTMDNNVHPGNTERLANALIRANKRFDFMPMPGQAHGFGQMQPYFTQMMWEYFAEHLLGDSYRKGAEMSEKRGG